MEKEEVCLCLVEKEKVREEKVVYTLLEGGEGERERDEINLGVKERKRRHSYQCANVLKNTKRDTAINPRTCYFCLYVLALIAVSRFVL